MQLLYKKNQGATTLLISAVILMLLGIVTLYTVRVNVMDQRMVASEADYQEAFAMAEAGLDFAVQRFIAQLSNNLNLGYQYTEVEVMKLANDLKQKYKTNGTKVTTGVAHFTVEMGCKLLEATNADEIVPCVADDAAILRRQSTFIKDRGLSPDAIEAIEIQGVPIYEIVATGFNTVDAGDTASKVTIRRKISIDPILGDGVSQVPLIVDGEVNIAGDYNIRPSDTGEEPIAIWASGNVYMRGNSAICTQRAALRNGDIHSFNDKAWRDDGDSIASRGGRGCWIMPENFTESDFKTIKMVGAGGSDEQPDRYCAWQGIYARAGIEMLSDISTIVTRWYDEGHGCSWWLGREFDKERNSTLCPVCTTEDVQRTVHDNSKNVKRLTDEPGSDNVVLGSGDTLLTSYDKQAIYRGILPNANTFTKKRFPADLFAYTFGVPRADWKMIKAKAQKRNQVEEDCNNDGLIDSAGYRYALWWIEGDCIMSNHQQIGSDRQAGPHPRSPRPVILVIEDGKLEMSENNTIYGRIFLFDNPDNPAKPSANFNHKGNIQNNRYPRIVGGLTSDVGDIEIEIGDRLIIDAYKSSGYANSFIGGTPQPALAEREVGRNYDLVYIPGSWRDY